MGKSTLEKREEFFKENPLVYEFYVDISNVNASCGGIGSERLKKIKEYAIAHTQFYKNYTVNDIFPVMTKLDFINNKLLIESNEAFDKPIHISSTSGSTGTPFSVRQNYEKRMRNIADLKVFGDYALYPSHEKMLQLRAYNGKKLDRSVDERENIWRYDISGLDGKRIKELIDFICTWEPDTVFGYTSTLETISDYVLENCIEFNPTCKSVLVGAEMLTDDTAEKIQKVFHCPIFDRYSNMEMGIYAQREYGRTNFKLNKASYYFEILKINCDEPADEHEIGRIVVTDLYNHAFPMIRYDTGDLGSYCMNGEEIEIETVYGRRMDSVYSTNGSIVDPHEVSRLLSHASGISQWQFIQMGSSQYQLKIKASGSVDEQDIIAKMQEIFGSDADLDVTYVDDVPVLSSQKRKPVINEWIH